MAHPKRGGPEVVLVEFSELSNLFSFLIAGYFWTQSHLGGVSGTFEVLVRLGLLFLAVLWWFRRIFLVLVGDFDFVGGCLLLIF